MTLTLIAILGFFMGVITSISGGAGVFAVPTMLAFGIPPVTTLALNRISDMGVLTGAVYNYIKSPEFDKKLAFIIALPLTIGAIVGANFSVSISPEKLKVVILFAIVIGLIFLLLPTRQLVEPKRTNWFIGVPALLIVGFWEGAVAMAGATFCVLVLVRLFNKSYLGARSTEIVSAIPPTLASTGILIWNSDVNLAMGLTMFASSILGAYLGSKMAIRKGSPFIRYCMVSISILMAGKVIYDLLA